MKRNEALPGKYLAKEDFAHPVLAEIAGVQIEEVTGDHGKESKPVLYLKNASDQDVDTSRGIILNGTNWDSISAIRGDDPDETDTDDWPGIEIVIYHDADVMFGRNKVGGIRIRKPNRASKAAPEPEPPPPADNEVPF